MNREKTLVKNTFILTIGKVCTQLITFLLLPLYTSILSTEEYGMVDLLNTLVSLLLPIVTFQVEQAVFRNLIEFRDNEKEKGKIITTAVLSVAIQCTIYLIIFFALSPFIHNDYKIFLAINVIGYIFASLFQQISRGLGENKKYAIASFISALTTILSNVILLVVFHFKVNGMLLGNLLGQLICVLFLCISLKVYKYLKFSEFKVEILKKMWRYSIPLVPNAISWWVFSASDRIIVSAILGVGQNGILSASHKFSTIYTTLYNIFNMSWTETIAVHIKDKDITDFFNKMFNIVIRLFISIGIGIIACIPFVYSILINNKFIDGYNQVPILLIGSIFYIMIGLMSTIYVAKKNTKAIANTSFFSAIINAVVHILLIGQIGLYAATISTLVAYLIMAIYRYFDIKKKYFKIIIQKEIIYKTVIILLLVLPAYYLRNKVICFGVLLIVILYAWNLNRKSIHVILDIIKNKFKNKVIT